MTTGAGRPAGQRTTRKEWWWAVVRLALGQFQIVGAVASAYLLLRTGMNERSLTVVAVTCLFTTVSVLLFGRRR
jgi:hypothetical protein